MRKSILLLFFIAVLTIGSVVLAQDETDEPPILQISVAGESCDLVLDVDTEPQAEATVEPESTPEPESVSDYPIITLSDDCDEVIPLLLVASNGTLWIALSVPDEEDWQEFESVPDDDHPPQFDGRGRFIGCRNPSAGEQVCSVLWELDENTYRIDIPIFVGNAYVPSSEPNTSSDDTAGGQCSPDGRWYDEAEALAINPSLASGGVYQCQNGTIMRLQDAGNESNENSGGTTEPGDSNPDDNGANDDPWGDDGGDGDG